MAPPFALPDGDAFDAAGRVTALADGVALTLRVARALVESGRRVELKGIEDAVGLLCARALDLPPQAGAPLGSRLSELLDDADSLCAALDGRRSPQAGRPGRPHSPSPPPLPLAGEGRGQGGQERSRLDARRRRPPHPDPLPPKPGGEGIDPANAITLAGRRPGKKTNGKRP